MAAGVLALGAAVAQGQLVASTVQPNVLVFGNFSSANTETNGALWVGGNASVSSYSVGVDLGGVSSSYPSLVVQNNLTWNNGQVFHGSEYVGGTRSVSGHAVPNGSVYPSVPVDFSALRTSAIATSQALSGLTSDYQSLDIKPWGQMDLQLHAGLNVVNISGSQLSQIGTWNISGAAGSQVVFNVSGTSYQHAVWTGMNSNQVTVSAQDILFNFYDASSVNLSTLCNVTGSVLAPMASVTTGYGSFHGQLVADSYSGNDEFYNQLFNMPPLTPVPEPAALGLIGVGGLGMLVLLRRMRRRAPAGANA